MWSLPLMRAGSAFLGVCRYAASLPGKGLDVAGMLADPQISQCLHAALDAFVRAIRMHHTNHIGR